MIHNNPEAVKWLADNYYPPVDEHRYVPCFLALYTDYGQCKIASLDIVDEKEVDERLYHGWKLLYPLERA